MRNNNKWDIRINYQIMFLFIELNWKPDNNLKLNNKESKNLLNLLSNIYNVKLPNITSITTNNNKKIYNSKSKTINIFSSVPLNGLLYSFYEYLSEITDYYYLRGNSSMEKGDYAYEYVYRFNKKLNDMVNKYVESEILANSIPKEYSYWTDSGRFYIFKQNSMLYLFTYYHNIFILFLQRLVSRNIDYNSLLQKSILENYKNSKILTDLCYKYISPYSGYSREDRSKKRLKQISNVFSLDFTEIKKNKKYLDLGGGDGSITYAIGNEFQLTKKDIISADLSDTFSVNENRDIDEITYVTLDSTSSKLPFKTSEFFFVSCFMVLHHIKDIHNELTEIGRIIRKGGYLLIREHDVTNIEEHMIIDLEHLIYDVVIDAKLKDCDNNKYFKSYNNTDIENGYVAYYFSREKWNTLITSYGFERVNIQLNDKNQKNNYNKAYYELYKKI